MISLLIDTCTNNLIIAVCKDSIVLYELVQKNDASLSTNFTSLVKNAIECAHISINDIDKIFVSNGPGSFTGVRIGVTFAKVFAWSKNIKVIPISSLELLASSFDTAHIVPLLDARRGYVYGSIYDQDLNPILNDSYIKLDELLFKTKGYNDIAYVSCDSFDKDILKPNYNIIKVINKHINDAGINPHSLVPNYLKKTEAEEKLEVKNV